MGVNHTKINYIINIKNNTTAIQKHAFCTSSIFCFGGFCIFEFVFYFGAAEACLGDRAIIKTKFKNAKTTETKNVRSAKCMFLYCCCAVLMF